MTAEDLIESYVDDVARRLPKKLRNDVGFELRSLLLEDLQAKAVEANRPTDPAMAMALLSAFGRPADVAEQYRPASFVIIKPTDTNTFAVIAIMAVVLQWVVSLPPVFIQPEIFPGQAVSRLCAWWVSFGLGAFWLPGFLIVVTIIARWFNYRWPRTRAWSPRQIVGRDHVNRALLACGIAALTLGAAVWIALPLIVTRLPGGVQRVLTMDSHFLHVRAPWLLAVWAGQFCLLLTVLVEGRWHGASRRVALGFNLTISALLAWFTISGPIFVSAVTDNSAKGFAVLMILFCLTSAVLDIIWEQARVRELKGLVQGRSVHN